MAFPVSSRSTGTLITASIWNNDLRDNINAIYGGSMSLPSQAAGDFVYASSSVALGRIAAVINKYPKFVNGVGWQMNIPGAGWHDGFIPASAMQPNVNTPCGWHERYTLTHGTYYGLPFSPTAVQYAGVNARFPRSWYNAGAITVTPIWLSMTPNGGNVHWTIYTSGLSNSESGNWTAAYGAAVVQAAYGQYLITSAAGASFVVGAAAKGDYMSFLIIRSGSDAADTYPDNALLLGLGVDIFTENDVDA